MSKRAGFMRDLAFCRMTAWCFLCEYRLQSRPFGRLCRVSAVFFDRLAAQNGRLPKSPFRARGHRLYWCRRGDETMKVHIELTEGLAEPEVTIRCARADETVRRIQRFALEQAAGECRLTFYKDGAAYFFPADEVLFFETEGEHVYAHTATDAFLVKRRLYELEQALPHAFVRVSKSAIANTARVYSVARGLAGAGPVQFLGSRKQVYVSRSYYKNLRRRLEERGSV